MNATCQVIFTVTFNSEQTDADSIGEALERLLETAMSTPGILDEYGPVAVINVVAGI